MPSNKENIAVGAIRKRKLGSDVLISPSQVDGSISQRKRPRLPIERTAKSKKLYDPKKVDLWHSLPVELREKILFEMDVEDLVDLYYKSEKISASFMNLTHTDFVWNVVLKRHGVPDPSLGQSNMEWALLLFGKECTACSKPTKVGLDFVIEKRLCDACRENLTVKYDDLNLQDGQLDDSMLQMIPAIGKYRGAKNVYFGQNLRYFYLKEDIQKITSEAAQYKKSSEGDTSLAILPSQSYEDFSAERKKDVRNLQRRAEEVIAWMKEYKMGQQLKAKLAQNKRFDGVMSYLAEKGYTKWQRTFIASDNRAFTHSNKSLSSDQVWNKHQDKLSSTIDATTLDYLNAYYDRLRIFHKRYWELLFFRVNIATLRMLPGSFDLSLSHFFADLFHQHPRHALTEASFTPSFNAFAQSLADSTFQQSILHACAVQIPNQQPADNRNRETLALPPSIVQDMLSLATSVFKCDFGHAIVDTAHILVHDCTRRKSGFIPIDGELVAYQPHLHTHIESEDILPGTNTPKNAVRKKYQPFQYTYSRQGSDVARQLIALASYDTTDITSTQMDHRDIRYLCLDCQGVNKQIALTWREALTHFLNKSLGQGVHHIVPRFKILQYDLHIREEELRLEREMVSMHAWACGHCALAPETGAPLLSVIGHLCIVHPGRLLGRSWKRNVDYFLLTELVPMAMTYREGIPFENAADLDSWMNMLE